MPFKSSRLKLNANAVKTRLKRLKNARGPLKIYGRKELGKTFFFFNYRSKEEEKQFVFDFPEDFQRNCY